MENQQISTLIWKITAQSHKVVWVGKDREGHPVPYPLQWALNHCHIFSSWDFPHLAKKFMVSNSSCVKDAQFCSSSLLEAVFSVNIGMMVPCEQTLSCCSHLNHFADDPVEEPHQLTAGQLQLLFQLVQRFMLQANP